MNINNNTINNTGYEDKQACEHTCKFAAIGGILGYCCSIYVITAPPFFCCCLGMQIGGTASALTRSEVFVSQPLSNRNIVNSNQAEDRTIQRTSTITTQAQIGKKNV